MEHRVAWLRGINVGAAGRGRKSVPMAELRELAESLGAREVRTYIQSGNLLFAGAGTADRWRTKLEAGIRARFGCEVPVVVSAAADLARARRACPFADAAAERPNLVHIGFTTGSLGRAVPAALAPYCTQEERVAVRGGFLWADYPVTIARSKLTPAVLDRVVGASVTMRNVKTLDAVLALLA
ncbi:MAG: DUF1697 domain-containing protein [Planctomycetota bacterium]